MRVRTRGTMLVAELARPHRSLSSAVLGGGLGWLRTWVNLGVPAAYDRTDPAEHLAAESAGLGEPVVGMLTAVDVSTYTWARRAGASAVATVGARHALAAAGTRPRRVPGAGTINLLVVVDEPLTDAGLAGAVQTAVEAKAQALADARVRAANAAGWATGTATDSLCVACPPGGRREFAGPATAAGSAVARAVHAAVLGGAVAERRDEVRGRAA